MRLLCFLFGCFIYLFLLLKTQAQIRFIERNERHTHKERERPHILNSYWEMNMRRKWHVLHVSDESIVFGYRNDQSTSIEKIDFCANWSKCSRGCLLFFFLFSIASTQGRLDSFFKVLPSTPNSNNKRKSDAGKKEPPKRPKRAPKHHDEDQNEQTFRTFIHLEHLFFILIKMEKITVFFIFFDLLNWVIYSILICDDLFLTTTAQ